jgi:hypothetical protein
MGKNSAGWTKNTPASMAVKETRRVPKQPAGELLRNGHSTPGIRVALFASNMAPALSPGLLWRLLAWDGGDDS